MSLAAREGWEGGRQGDLGGVLFSSPGTLSPLVARLLHVVLQHQPGPRSSPDFPALLSCYTATAVPKLTRCRFGWSAIVGMKSLIAVIV